jgi:protein tyrosine phosphatase
MPKWIRDGELAISPRPGYRPGAEFTVPRAAVDSWIDETRAAGIASIICLLDRDQLPLYERGLPDGLLAYYREAGFAVARVPTPDGMQHPFTPEQLESAWEAYQHLPKPVLVHCSAGHDRTGRVIDYLLRRLGALGAV